MNRQDDEFHFDSLEGRSAIVFENSRMAGSSELSFIIQYVTTMKSFYSSSSNKPLRYSSKNQAAATREYKNFSHLYFEVHNNNSLGMYSQLSFVGQDCQKIPSVLAQLYGPRVQFLDLSFNCLTTLHGIEKFMNLKELVLDNNNLNDKFYLPRLQHLHTLSLNKNNITNLELLLTKVSHNLPCLHYLSLLGNVACPNQLSDADKDEEDYQRYRYYVLHCLPHLRFLDSRPVTTEEKREADRRGQFMKVIRPNTEASIGDELSSSLTSSAYSPLPNSGRDIGDHQGAYGKCRYRYSGKHSEGNRFILNNDL